jgi:FixJ family two-component response regulator
MELTQTNTSATKTTTGTFIGVVDDDASILRALQRLLRAAGFTVQTFNSGEELLAWEQLDRIDCLVLDVHLAGISGFDVQERLTDAQRIIPTVFITAHDDASTRERARRLAFSQYLRKPFDEQSLIAAIEAAVSRG